VVTKRTMRTRLAGWARLTHMYGGLVFSSYFVLYAVTSIGFNHRVQRDFPYREAMNWAQQLSWPDAVDHRSRAEGIRDQLGLVGPIMGPVEEAAGGNLVFQVHRPGVRYTVRTDRATGMAQIHANRRGIRSVLSFMHGQGPVRGSWLMGGWWLFTEASWVFLLISALSGSYMWLRRGNPVVRWGGLSVSGAVFVLVFLWVIGW